MMKMVYNNACGRGGDTCAANGLQGSHGYKGVYVCGEATKQRGNSEGGYGGEKDAPMSELCA